MAPRFNHPQKTLHIAVTDFADTIHLGHLGQAPISGSTQRLQLGQKTHRDWANEPHEEGFQSEVSLRAERPLRDWTLHLSGRVDGLIQSDLHTVVQELKSTYLGADSLYSSSVLSFPSYVFQVQLYLWMLHQKGYAHPIGQLILISTTDGSRHLLPIPFNPEDVEKKLDSIANHLLACQLDGVQWMKARNKQRIPLPHDQWRDGQQSITTQTHRALQAKQPIFVQAPTGLGKTAAILDATLRFALGTGRRIFWATARGTQSRAVFQTLQRFKARGLQLRAVPLVAKQRICPQSEVKCDPIHCPMAEDYFEKIREKDSVKQLLSVGLVEQERALHQATTDTICPHQLLHDSSRRADIVVGDYNYLIAPDIQLKRFFSDENADQWIVVVDEAHQLLHRARRLRSPTITLATINAVRTSLKTHRSAFSRAALRSLSAVEGLILKAISRPRRWHRSDGAQVELDPKRWRDLCDQIEQIGISAPPSPGETPPDAWTTFAWELIRFTSRLEESGEESRHIVSRRQGEESVGLLCLDPSRWIGPLIHRLGGFVAASATLSPPELYRDLFGLEGDDPLFISVGPSFPPENLGVFTVPSLSTRYRDRAAHATKTAEVISEVIASTPGNVAVFFPSFSMLDDLASRVHLRGRQLLAQRPNLEDSLRSAWVDALSRRDDIALFAVMGGLFSEGVDLPEGGLRTIVIVGPALPPVGFEQTLLQDYYEERFSKGYLYASLAVGLTKVIQAAGRLIRRPTDRGTLVLIGRRFSWREYRALLPPHWRLKVSQSPGADVLSFWTDP